MKNRYDKVLREGNKLILELNTANETLRLVLAFEFKKYYRQGQRVLEIGCGEGDSAKKLLEYSTASLDLLDISPEMIRFSKKNLAKYQKRIRFICEDALSYLQRSDPYDIITSSWTIHNFLWKDKEELLETIYEKLSPNGVFLLMDKVYPNRESKHLLEIQLKRFVYLPSVVSKEIIAHEKVDYTSRYRMDKKKFITVLKRVGFRKALIMDRVERDAVLVAAKWGF